MRKQISDQNLNWEAALRLSTHFQKMQEVSATTVKSYCPLRLDPVLEAQFSSLKSMNPLKELIDLIQPSSVSSESRSKSSDTFRSAIQSMITDSEADGNQLYNLLNLCDIYGFQKRRLYDVVNVLEVVGACKKVTSDSIRWIGISQVPETLRQLQVKYGTNKPSATLEQIFPSEKCVSITHLTSSLILFFFALRKKTLDIKQIGIFLSRQNGRYKTTLCKLYQISHILEAAGIVAKSQIPGEIAITQPYYQLVRFEKDEIPQKLFSINSLLVGEREFLKTDPAIEERRFEYLMIFQKLRTKYLGRDLDSDESDD